MRVPDAVRGRPEQTILSLDLLNAISGKIVASTSTTSHGAFDFGETAPGIYFIHLKASSARGIEGLISVELDSGAPPQSDSLDLNLSWTSCGLMYTDLRRRPKPELHVKALRGHIGDSVGHAEIFLLDAGQNQVAHASADRDGNFSLPDSLMGTFELRVEGDVFSPVRIPLHLEPTADSSSLEIQAGFFSCSAIWAK